MPEFSAQLHDAGGELSNMGQPGDPVWLDDSNVPADWTYGRRLLEVIEVVRPGNDSTVAVRCAIAESSIPLVVNIMIRNLQKKIDVNLLAATLASYWTTEEIGEVLALTVMFMSAKTMMDRGANMDALLQEAAEITDQKLFMEFLSDLLKTLKEEQP